MPLNPVARRPTARRTAVPQKRRPPAAEWSEERRRAAHRQDKCDRKAADPPEETLPAPVAPGNGARSRPPMPIKSVRYRALPPKSVSRTQARLTPALESCNAESRAAIPSQISANLYLPAASGDGGIAAFYSRFPFSRFDVHDR